jgi:hypothetical protein
MAHLALRAHGRFAVPVDRCPGDGERLLDRPQCLFQQPIARTQHIDHRRRPDFERCIAERQAEDGAQVLLELARCAGLDRVVAGVVRPRRDLVDQHASAG